MPDDPLPIPPWSPLRQPDTQSFLAIIAALGVIGLAFYLAVTGKSDSDVFKILIGALISVGLTQVYQYYFGSSKGSATKDDQSAATFKTLVNKVVKNGATGDEK